MNLLYEYVECYENVYDYRLVISMYRDRFCTCMNFNLSSTLRQYIVPLVPFLSFIPITVYVYNAVDFIPFQGSFYQCDVAICMLNFSFQLDFDTM